MIQNDVDMLTKKFSQKLKDLSSTFLLHSAKEKYSYNFQWYGRPIIQYPQDIVALQEIIWKIKPDLIIETGIAHGGSLIFSATNLAMLDLIESVKKKISIKAWKTKRKVIGIDIKIKKKNKLAITQHPLSYMIHMITGSSVDKKVFNKVKLISKKFKKILVLLDSNHTFEHVFAELNLYSSLVSKNSYCIVYDTLVGDLPKSVYPNRPWGPNNSPKKAVKLFLNQNKNFLLDKKIFEKLLITVSKDGYIKKL